MNIFSVEMYYIAKIENRGGYLTMGKGKKIVIVGGVGGGATAAARLRRLDENAEIVMFERGPHVSFSNCSLPFHLSGVVQDHESLILKSPAQLYGQYRIDARVLSEVTSIDRENKQVHIKNLETNEEYVEKYDKLILSPGANPIIPPFEGMDDVNLFTMRNVGDVVSLDSFLKEKKCKDVTVIGGGFIGIEVAENLRMAGYDVTIVEALDQIMKPFDYDMVQILHKEIYDKKINLIVGDKVSKFEKDTVVLDSGRKIKSDAVVMAIGVSPETSLAKDADLDIGETKAIKVDQSYRTNDKDIYAVGDAIEVYNSLLHSQSRLALGGPAQRQARSAADHIYGKTVSNPGVIGSSVIQVFDYNAASTGLTEGLIKATDMQIEYDIVRLVIEDKVGLMPDKELIHLKVIFEVPTGRILGAQAIGKGAADKRIDVIATVIKFNGTLQDLKELELTYAPPFNNARGVINQAGLVGLNILEGAYKQVYVEQAREIVESGAYILDVRTEKTHNMGHLKNAVNIPVAELRDRLDEIPKDRPVYMHCTIGQNSYGALMALQQLGFDNISNISGGFAGISFYEYFNDKTTDREPIVTDYIFKKLP